MNCTLSHCFFTNPLGQGVFFFTEARSIDWLPEEKEVPLSKSLKLTFKR